MPSLTLELDTQHGIYRERDSHPDCRAAPRPHKTSDSETTPPLRLTVWAQDEEHWRARLSRSILLFDRRHPSVPTCAQPVPARAAAVKDGPSSGHRVSGAQRT